MKEADSYIEAAKCSIRREMLHFEGIGKKYDGQYVVMRDFDDSIVMITIEKQEELIEKIRKAGEKSKRLMRILFGGAYVVEVKNGKFGCSYWTMEYMKQGGIAFFYNDKIRLISEEKDIGEYARSIIDCNITPDVITFPDVDKE